MPGRATRSTVAIIVSGLALALALGACSGGSKTKTAAASAPASAPVASATPAASSGGSTGRGGAAAAGFQQYLTCLRSKGVPIASFSGRPGGAGSRAPGAGGSFSRPPGGFGSRAPGAGGGLGGLGALASTNPSDAAAIQACASLRPTGGFGAAGGRTTISAATFAAFTSCMSDNGVTVTGTNPQTAIRALNRSDAKTAAALKICQAILGTAGAGGSAVPVPSAAPSAAASS
jgi:hypothetical protein